MSDNHEHTPEQPQGRQPNPFSVITVLNQRLDQKATEMRQLENAEVFKAALISDMTNEAAALTAMLDQIRAENSVLRKRLGLPEVGPVEITEEEAAGLGPEANVQSVAEPGDLDYVADELDTAGE